MHKVRMRMEWNINLLECMPNVAGLHPRLHHMQFVSGLSVCVCV